MKLLVGLYQPLSGRIVYNGIPGAEIDLDALRAQIGFVTQDTQLFSGTIRENLLFVNPGASDDECLDVMRQAACDSLLARAWVAFRAPLAVLVAVHIVGALGFWIISDGKASVVDCIYMVFVTVTSIGYGEIAAFGRQVLDGVGDQPHRALQVGDAVGSLGRRAQLSLPAAAPRGGPSLSPALPSATANAFSRMAATREAVGAIMTSSDAISGPSKSPCARPHRATRVASSRLTLEQVGRWISMARRAPNRKASMAMAKSGSTSSRPAILKPRWRIEPSAGKARSCCHWRRAHSTKRSLTGKPQAQPARPQPGFGSA